MKKIKNNKVISANPRSELAKIERIKQDYDIIIEKHKDKQTINVYYRTLLKNAIFYTLECIGNYINISKKTENKILLLADEVNYLR
jgi:hypothetical protein